MILIIKYLAIAVIAYLLGAIPFGLVISKKLVRVDIREHGSGNIGATNVLRVLGLRYGLLTAVLDLAKTIIALLLAVFIVGGESLIAAGYDIHVQVAQVIAALMAMVGHNWSVYIGFKGGKGVATFFAGLLMINWIVALSALAVGLIAVLLTRYVSVGSMVASIVSIFAFAVVAILNDSFPVYLIYAFLTAALIIYQHRSNIARLQSGTESRIGDKKARVRN